MLHSVAIQDLPAPGTRWLPDRLGDFRVSGVYQERSAKHRKTVSEYPFHAMFIATTNRALGSQSAQVFLRVGGRLRFWEATGVRSVGVSNYLDVPGS